MTIMPEQILRKYLPKPVNEAEANDDIYIIKAMKEYAEVVKNNGVLDNVRQQRELLTGFVRFERLQDYTYKLLPLSEKIKKYQASL